MKYQSKFINFHSRKFIEHVVRNLTAILSRPQCVKMSFRGIYNIRPQASREIDSTHPGVGVTKPISSIPFFPIFCHSQSTGYQSNILFLFDRCCHSWATVRPIKHENDSKNLAGILAKSNISSMEKLMYGALITITSVAPCTDMVYLNPSMDN